MPSNGVLHIPSPRMYSDGLQILKFASAHYCKPSSKGVLQKAFPIPLRRLIIFGQYCWLPARVFTEKRPYFQSKDSSLLNL